MTNTEYLHRYDLLPHGSKVLCALSGGRDSVYLLHRLLEWADERKLTISAAHYNHHLRGEESQRDEDFVKQLCSELHVPLYLGGSDVRAYAEEHGMGVETAARELRYGFLEQTLEKIGGDVIATAHHADDLAETMLLNMVRGAGTAGLSGIPPRRGNIIRPILTVTRKEIDRYLNEHKLAYVEDSTNAEEHTARNILRHRVMPVLSELNDSFAEHAVHAALRLREDEAYLQQQADLFLASRPIEEGIPLEEMLKLERPIAARVIRSVWGSRLEACHVQQILDLCHSNKLAYAHVPDGIARCDSGRLWRQEETPLLEEVLLEGEEGQVQYGEYRIRWKRGICTEEVHNSFNTFMLKYENMKHAVAVTGRREGDRVKFAGQAHTKRLKQLFQERKLTQPQRAAVPVFRDEQGIAAVYGFGVAQRCVPEIGDKILYIQCDK